MDQLEVTLKMLAVFIDETGNEDFSDPKFPIFGRGGCAIIGAHYKATIEKPWRQLKRFRLGGANKPFHAVEFSQLPPTNAQIYAINTFMKRKFHRFFCMVDSNLKKPAGIDGHKTVSLVLPERIKDIAKNLDIDCVALIFESSGRGNTLVERDFDLANIGIVNIHGQKVEVDGYFLDKKSMTAGLEVADLIVHTAGRQARKIYNNNASSKFNLDYQEVFHKIDLGLGDGFFIRSLDITA